MGQLSVLLLGAPQIQLGEREIRVDTRKAIALLAYLAVTGETHTRDALATLLWPELDQSRARAGLRRTLSPLRQALDKQFLVVDRESLALRGDVNLWLDVDVFRQLVASIEAHPHASEEVCTACIPPLARAAELYRDDFMAGFTLRDAPDFDDWQFYQAEQLRRELGAVLERLAEAYAATGAYEAAIAAAHRLLALDPLTEAGYRLLMQLYAWSGQRNAALQQYRKCVRVLEQELGVPPLDETRALYERILAEESPPPPAVGRAPAATTATGDVDEADVLGALPLVGRAPEWAALQAAYDAAGSGQCVVVAGESGVGKTRLCLDYVDQVQRDGALAVTVRCYEGETELAYHPFIVALRAGLEQAPDGWLEDVPPYWLTEASRLLPELTAHGAQTAPSAPLDGPGAQSRFFEGVFQVMLSLLQPRDRKPSVLFFDDAHWADPASLELLAYLLRRLQGRPLFILVAWSHTGIAPAHRLQQIVRDGQRQGWAAQLLLDRLSRDDVTRLVQETPAAAETPRDSFATRLYEETEGLPLFIAEYLKVIAPTAGEEWPLPGGVRDVLRARLAAVDDVEWQLLHTAAVIGRAFPLDTWRAASGRSEEEMVLAVERLLRRGLIEERGSGATGMGTPDPIYDFAHSKLRAVVYEDTSLIRRRLLHRRVATALQARDHSESQAGQIAYHFEQAGMDETAAEYYARAGVYARSLYANAEAIAHFQRALALGHPDPAFLHEALGTLQTLIGDYAAAIQSYETAIALAPPQTVPELEHRLGLVYQRRGDLKRAGRHFQVALAGTEPLSPAQKARVLTDWSLTAHLQGDGERAEELAAQALSLAEGGEDPHALAHVHNMLGLLARHKGDAVAAGQHLEKSLQLATELGEIEAQVAALNNLALADAARGATSIAGERLQAALTLCLAQGDRHRAAALHNNLADLFHATGEGETAMQHLKLAAALFAEIGSEESGWQPEIWKLTEW